MNGIQGLDQNKIKNFYYNKMIACLSGGANKDYITNSKATGFTSWSPNNVRYIYLSPTRIEVVCYLKNALTSSPVQESEIKISQTAFGNAYCKSPLNALVAGRVFSNLEAIFLDVSSGVPFQWYMGAFLKELHSSGEQGGTPQDKYPMFRGVFAVNPNVFKHATDVFKTPKGVPLTEQDVSEMYNFLLNKGIVQKIILWNRVVRTYSLRPKWYDLDAPGGHLAMVLKTLVSIDTKERGTTPKRDTSADKDQKSRVRANQNEKLLGGLLSIYIETMKLCAIARRSGNTTKEMEPYLASLYSSSEEALRHVSGVFYSETKPYVVNVLGVGTKRLEMLSRVGFCVQSIGDPNWDYRGSAKFTECMDKVMVNLYNGLFDGNNGLLGYLGKAFPDLHIPCDAETMSERLVVICRVFKEFCNHLYKNARLNIEPEVILFDKKEPKFEQISAREAASKGVTISPLCGDYIVLLFELFSTLSYFSKISVSYPEGTMQNLLNTVASEIELTKVGREYMSFYNTEYVPAQGGRTKSQYILFRKMDSKLLVDSIFGNQKDIKLEDTLEAVSGYTDEIILSRLMNLNTLINNTLFSGLNFLFSHATKDFVPDAFAKEPYKGLLHYKMVKQLGIGFEGTLTSKYAPHLIETPDRLPHKFIAVHEKALVYCLLGVTGSSLQHWVDAFNIGSRPNIDILYGMYLKDRYVDGCNLRDLQVVEIQAKMEEKLNKIPSEDVERFKKLIAGYVIACRVCLADNLICNLARKDGTTEKIQAECAFADKWIERLSAFGLDTSIGEEVGWGKTLSKQGYKYYVGKADIKRLISCGFIKQGTFTITRESLETLEKRLVSLLSEFRSNFLNLSSATVDNFLNTGLYGNKLALIETSAGSPTLKRLKTDWTEKIAHGFLTSKILEDMESEENKVKSVEVGKFLDNTVVMLKYVKYLYQLMSDKYVKGIFPDVADKVEVSDIDSIQDMASSIPNENKFGVEDVNQAKSKMDSSRDGLGLLLFTGLVKKEGTAPDSDEAIKDTGTVVLNFLNKSLSVIEVSLQVYSAFSKTKGGLKSVGTLLSQLKGADIAGMSRTDMAKMLAPSLNELYSIFYAGSKDISTSAWHDRLLK